MTTHDTDTAAIRELAASLTELQIYHLQRVASGKNLLPSDWLDLNTLGLVGVKYTTELANQDYITDLGNQVLGLLENEAARATGEADKFFKYLTKGETTITAQQFVDHDFPAKIANRECNVIDHKGRPLQYRFADSWGHYCFGISESANASWLYSPSDMFTVQWLPETANASEQAQAGEAVPEILDVDGFQHAVLNIYGDLTMGRVITERKVNAVQQAHEEIVNDLQGELETTYASLNACRNEITALRQQFAAGQASLSEPVTGYGLLEGTTLADLIGNWRDKHGFLSDMDSHVGNLFCDVIEKQQTEISRLQAALEAEQATSAGLQAQNERLGGLLTSMMIVAKPFATTYQTWLDRPESETHSFFIEWLYDHLKTVKQFGYVRNWFDKLDSVYNSVRITQPEVVEQALAASERGIADDPFAADGNE